MAENKKSFVLYLSWFDEIDKLSITDAGKLFKSIYYFVKGENPTVDKNIEELYFKITEQIKYEWSKFNPKTNKYHWNYQGGITPENKTIRNSIEMKLWRKKVFERDNYTCQNCFKKGGELNAHHIKEFSNYPKLRFEVLNGITLCKKCHLEEHRKIKLIQKNNG